jgi:hypothetical protein
MEDKKANLGLVDRQRTRGPGIEDHFKFHLMERFITTMKVCVGIGRGRSLFPRDRAGSSKLLEIDDRQERYLLSTRTSAQREGTSKQVNSLNH